MYDIFIEKDGLVRKNTEYPLEDFYEEAEVIVKDEITVNIYLAKDPEGGISDSVHISLQCLYGALTFGPFKENIETFMEFSEPGWRGYLKKETSADGETTNRYSFKSSILFDFYPLTIMKRGKDKMYQELHKQL